MKEYNENAQKEGLYNKQENMNIGGSVDKKSQAQEFFSKVQRYFNSEIEFQQKNAKEDSDFEVIEYLNNNKNTLSSLFNEKLFLRKKPEDFSMAISDLAGQMSNFDPFNSLNINLPEDITKDFDKRFSEIKDIYMKACKKIYQNVNLNSTNDPEFYPLKSLNDNKAFSKKSQINFINHLLNTYSSSLRATSFENFLKMDDNFDKVNNELFRHNESIYKLFILKDQLQKELYGRSDMSLNDYRKINSIKDDIAVPEQKENSTVVYEDITENNFDKYLKENKEIFFDGSKYKIEVNNNGDIFINRPISIKEALKIARGATVNNNVNTGMIKTRMFSVTKELLFTDAKWIIKDSARRPEDTERLKEINEIKELQRIITETNEFNENIGGSFQLLNDVFLREVERLNKEKEQFEKNIK